MEGFIVKKKKKNNNIEIIEIYHKKSDIKIKFEWKPKKEKYSWNKIQIESNFCETDKRLKEIIHIIKTQILRQLKIEKKDKNFLNLSRKGLKEQRKMEIINYIFDELIEDEDIPEDDNIFYTYYLDD